MVNVGDKFIFNSENGMQYKIEIVNVNHYREPSMIYGADIYDCNGVYAGDVMFFGEDFIQKCVKCDDNKSTL